MDQHLRSMDYADAALSTLHTGPHLGLISALRRGQDHGSDGGRGGGGDRDLGEENSWLKFTPPVSSRLGV